MGIIKSKSIVEGKSPFKSITNLGAAVRKATEILLPNSRESIPVDMFASSCLPYQASKTYKKLTTESDCKRTKTLIDVQMSLRRL